MMRNTERFISRGPAIFATNAISLKLTDREGGIKVQRAAGPRPPASLHYLKREF